jgi:hypothetical protein
MSEEKPENRKLTKKEEEVIVHKGTEAPFTGKYYAFWDKGTYICKRCGTPLYRSETQTEFERKSNVPNAAPTWVTFSPEKVSQKKTRDIASILSQLSLSRKPIEVVVTLFYHFPKRVYRRNYSKLGNGN